MLPIVLMLIFLFIIGLILAALWKIFEKAGEKGWTCLIPLYNGIVFLRIVGKPWWWIFLMGGPVLNITNKVASLGMQPFTTFTVNIFSYIFIVWAYNMLSKSFGKDAGFTAGLLFLGFIFFPILGFGDAKYLGPYGNKEAFDAMQQSNTGFDFEHDVMSDTR